MPVLAHGERGAQIITITEALHVLSEDSGPCKIPELCSTSQPLPMPASQSKTAFLFGLQDDNDPVVIPQTHLPGSGLRLFDTHRYLG